MDKSLTKHMKWCKYVKNTQTGIIYKLIEDMNAEKETVRVVSFENLERYRMLGAWIENYESDSFDFRERFTGNIEDCKIERKTYEEEQRIADVTPRNEIPFITPNYKTLFVVTELDFVEVDKYDFINGEYIKNGTEKKRVIADDCETNGFLACHFHFEGEGRYWHIHEYASRINPNGDAVKQCSLKNESEVIKNG